MIDLAQVVAVYPGGRRVDLVMLNTGARMARVAVAAGSLGTDHGTWATPSVPKPARENLAGGIAPDGARTVLAVVAMMHGRGVVLGFVPFAGAFAVTEDNRDIHRHVSGAYVTIAPDGSIEARHPGGAYLRIGTGDHVDVPGVPAAPSGAPAATVTVQTPDAKLTIKPGGDVELTTSGVLKATYASAELHGDIALTGTLTATVDVVANGTSLHSHKHGGVGTGTGQTGVPV